MCGITGVYNHHSGRQVDREMIERMCGRIVHRGPDDQGMYLKGPVGLGMRRLSIIDLETGAQPIFNEDRSVVTIFNGEIYNYQELRRELIERGHHFKTCGDTEVIVHLYEEYGLDFANHLNGMFAIALWDGVRRRLVLIRDRLGQKPLCFAPTKGGIVFGSELKCLLESGEVETEIDHRSVQHYFTLGYIPHPMSIYKPVKWLEPGGRLVIENDQWNRDCYWTLDTRTDPSLVTDDLAEHMFDLLTDAVRLRMVGEVPLGAFLSGGLDSSIIVALMSQLSSQPIKTFHVDFADQKNSERAYAQAIADHFETEHHELTVKPSAVEVLDDLVNCFDEPFGDSSAVPTYYLSQLTREHVTVALGGDGGDEIFGGYERYLRILNRRKLSVPVRKVLGGLGNAIHQVLPHKAPGRRYFRSLGMCSNEYFMVGTAEMETRELLSREFLEPIKGFSTYDELRGVMDQADCGDLLRPYSTFDLNYYLPADILTKLDRMSMAHSLELRSPMLDYRVVEMAARIPHHQKVQGTTTKWLLKKIFKQQLPQQVTQQRKQGFALPLASWLCEELRPILEDALYDPLLIQSEIFNLSQVRQLADEHWSGVRDRTTPLWNYLFFARWWQQYNQLQRATVRS